MLRKLSDLPIRRVRKIVEGRRKAKQKEARQSRGKRREKKRKGEEKNPSPSHKTDLFRMHENA